MQITCLKNQLHYINLDHHNSLLDLQHTYQKNDKNHFFNFLNSFNDKI